MKTDIEISQEYNPMPVKWIGAKIGYHDYDNMENIKQKFHTILLGTKMEN